MNELKNDTLITKGIERWEQGGVLYLSREIGMYRMRGEEWTCKGMDKRQVIGGVYTLSRLVPDLYKVNAESQSRKAELSFNAILTNTRILRRWIGQLDWVRLLGCNGCLWIGIGIGVGFWVLWNLPKLVEALVFILAIILTPSSLGRRSLWNRKMYVSIKGVCSGTRGFSP